MRRFHKYYSTNIPEGGFDGWRVRDVDASQFSPRSGLQRRTKLGGSPMCETYADINLLKGDLAQVPEPEMMLGQTHHKSIEG